MCILLFSTAPLTGTDTPRLETDLFCELCPIADSATPEGLLNIVGITPDFSFRFFKLVTMFTFNASLL